MKEDCLKECKKFGNGEVRHHKDCPNYSESLSRMYDELLEKYLERYCEKEELLSDFFNFVSWKFGIDGEANETIKEYDKYLITKNK